MAVVLAQCLASLPFASTKESSDCQQEDEGGQLEHSTVCATRRRHSPVRTRTSNRRLRHLLHSACAGRLSRTLKSFPAVLELPPIGPGQWRVGRCFMNAHPVSPWRPWRFSLLSHSCHEAVDQSCRAPTLLAFCKFIVHNDSSATSLHFFIRFPHLRTRSCLCHHNHTSIPGSLPPTCQHHNNNSRTNPTVWWRAPQEAISKQQQLPLRHQRRSHALLRLRYEYGLRRYHPPRRKCLPVLFQSQVRRPGLPYDCAT